MVKDRFAHYHFTVKDNQRTLHQDIALFFENRKELDYGEPVSIRHGRIETRRIWATAELNDYFDFPYVGQAFIIEQERIEKKIKQTWGTRALKIAHII